MISSKKKNSAILISLIFILGSASIYLISSATIFCFIKFRGGPRNVTIQEILLLPLPHRWAQYEVKQGRALIKEALNLLHAGDFKAGTHALRVGLAKAPDDQEGLLLFAQLQIDLRRPDLAEKTLLTGLKYHRRDPAYFKTVLSFLFVNQKDQQAFSLCDDLLRQQSKSTSPAPPEITQIASLGAATACYYRGNYDQAESYLLNRNLLNNPRESGLLTAKIQWERGYRELALHQLRTLTQDFPADEEIYAQLINYLREDSRDDEARQFSLVFQLARPEAARPRIELLRDSLRAHDHAAFQAEADATLQYFSHNADALLALAEFAATTGNPALVRQVQAQLPSTQGQSEAVALLVIEALVVAKDYPSALAAAAEFARQTPSPPPHYLNISNGLQAIAHYGNHDPEAGLLCLNNYLAAENLRAGNLVAIANRLKEIGARQPSRATLSRAVAADPLNQAALTSLIESDIEDENTDALPTHVRQLLTTRKPSRQILAQAQELLGSDRLLFSRERTVALEAIRAQLAIAKLPAQPSLL